MINLRQLMDFHLLGRHRLEAIQLLPLGSSIPDAIESYGEPLETEPSEETSEITRYTFRVGPYHQAVALEWKETVQSITYWSEKSDPGRDLICMLERYKDGSRWRVLEEGYWYQREDEVLRLWCSVVPAIGVAYVEFFAAKAEYKKAKALEGLRDLPDDTWMENDAVFELQRRFVQEKNAGLVDLCNRSDRIVSSPDGRHVFIVRDHRADDVENGFMEMNSPPNPETGYSTQVINCFAWGEDGSSWGKITLPRDAEVERIRFHGDECELRIRRPPAGRVLTFRGSAAAIHRLSAGTIGVAHENDELWDQLEDAHATFGDK